jgi:rod shape-determining protein MreD
MARVDRRLPAGRNPMSAMSGNTARGRLIVALSFVVALILMVIPVPDWAEPYRPDWVGLVLIYWCMATPSLVAVGSGWLVGLVADVAQGTLLGQNALAKTVMAFLAGVFHLRVRMFPLWQQSLFVFALVLINQALVFWIKGLLGQYVSGWTYWMPSVSSMVIWPWLFIVLRDVRRFGRVG